MDTDSPAMVCPAEEEEAKNGAGTPGRLSHDTQWMQSGDDRRATPQNSGGYGGLFVVYKELTRCVHSVRVDLVALALPLAGSGGSRADSL